MMSVTWHFKNSSSGQCLESAVDSATKLSSMTLSVTDVYIRAYPETLQQ